MRKEAALLVWSCVCARVAGLFPASFAFVACTHTKVWHGCPALSLIFFCLLLFFSDLVFGNDLKTEFDRK
jgi:hypothetical protein